MQLIWIDVKDNQDFPKDRPFVIVTIFGHITIATYKENKKWFHVLEEHCCLYNDSGKEDLTKFITHWLALPEMPNIANS